MRAAFVLLLLVGHAAAIPPPFVADEELAKAETIVLASWTGAAIREDHTVELQVIRSIRGSLSPGLRRVRLARFVGWMPDGGPVMSFTSTEMLGDVEDVRNRNLWFLTASEEEDGLPLAFSYRSVQPSTLEAYFAALASEEPRKEVSKLLSSSKDPTTLRRVLAYVGCGSAWPGYTYPDGPEFSGTASRRTPRCPHARAAVLELVRGPVAAIRAEALATWVDLVSVRPARAVPILRDHLHDRDPKVRAVCVATLARWKHPLSLPVFPAACEGLDDPRWACELVRALARWGHPGVVPALIGFLQDDGFAGRTGEDYEIPALLARKALGSITGCWFSFDVRRSRELWASNRELGPGLERPLAATFAPAGKHAVRIVIENRDLEPVAIARLPHDLTLRYGGTLSGRTVSVPETAEEFTTLPAGGTYEFELPVDPGFLATDPSRRRLVLAYIRNGHEWGVKAWLGVLIAAERK